MRRRGSARLSLYVGEKPGKAPVFNGVSPGPTPSLSALGYIAEPACRHVRYMLPADIAVVLSPGHLQRFRRYLHAYNYSGSYIHRHVYTLYGSPAWYIERNNTEQHANKRKTRLRTCNLVCNNQVAIKCTSMLRIRVLYM